MATTTLSEGTFDPADYSRELEAAPRKLTRSGHAAWTLTQLTFAPSTPAP